MHGLVNRSLQSFLRDTYGAALWDQVAEASGAPAEGFEAMFSYDDGLTDRLLDSAVGILAKPRDALLEDLGMFLVSLEPLRRLLRFSGVSYVDFLHSLDELPDRARLAVAEIGLPELTLVPREGEGFLVRVGHGHPGFVPVFAGILRAMADDYGAFAVVDIADPRTAPNAIRVDLLEPQFASGRRFDLGRPEAR